MKTTPNGRFGCPKLEPAEGGEDEFLAQPRPKFIPKSECAAVQGGVRVCVHEEGEPQGGGTERQTVRCTGKRSNARASGVQFTVDFRGVKFIAERPHPSEKPKHRHRNATKQAASPSQAKPAAQRSGRVPSECTTEKAAPEAPN
ncbi:hypothetical protein ZHAS_00021664 [Anopheles sinensis]|uniref:Uncharacterized protein n=1 Tax=Anopheles sinensis TaxID=74873 RepID=A0A084WT11_ANOSI|nr:hypothetical protein ZHAS_00021664 [Anopheles sinensis]